jgi:hypothetical protein
MIFASGQSGMVAVSAGVPLQHDLRCGIGFLQINAPVAEFFERDGNAGYGATYEGSRPYDSEIAVKIFDLGLSGYGRGSIGTIEQNQPPGSGLVRLEQR